MGGGNGNTHADTPSLCTPWLNLLNHPFIVWRLHILQGHLVLHHQLFIFLILQIIWVKKQTNQKHKSQQFNTAKMIRLWLQRVLLQLQSCSHYVFVLWKSVVWLFMGLSSVSPRTDDGFTFPRPVVWEEVVDMTNFTLHSDLRTIDHSEINACFSYCRPRHRGSLCEIPPQQQKADHQVGPVIL